jgi:hypothetical protein
LQKEENLLLEKQQSNEFKVTIMRDIAKQVTTTTAAVPLSYSQLYEIVEEKTQLKVQDFELRRHKDSNVLSTDWSWHYSSPLTVYVSPYSGCSVY